MTDQLGICHEKGFGNRYKSWRELATQRLIARELGVPAVVGCGDATKVLQNGTDVTVSCAEGDEGYVYQGALDTEVTDIEVGALKKLPLKIMMNLGNPQLAFEYSQIPNDGIGLARLEFIINNNVGIPSGNFRLPKCFREH